MTQREAFISTRSYHFQTMIHGYGPGKIPFSILRKYWAIAITRAKIIYPPRRLEKTNLYTGLESIKPVDTPENYDIMPTSTLGDTHD